MKTQALPKRVHYRLAVQEGTLLHAGEYFFIRFNLKKILFSIDVIFNILEHFIHLCFCSSSDLFFTPILYQQILLELCDMVYRNFTSSPVACFSIDLQFDHDKLVCFCAPRLNNY